MTLDQFVEKWLGKEIDFDGAYRGQCVDLYRMYCKEVLNVPQSPGVEGAADIWTTYLAEHFDKIPNTPEGVPAKGDIVIWNRKAGGGFGHVAVFIEGNTNEFTSFDQNWPTLSVCTKTKHTYSNVYGWLKPKFKPTDYRGYDLTNTDSMIICVNDHIKVAEGQLVEKTIYETAKGQLLEKDKIIEDLSKKLGEAISATKDANESAKMAKEALANELNDQLDWAKVAEDEQEAHKITKNQLSSFLWEIEDDLKLSHPSDDMDTRISVALTQLQSQIQTNISYQNRIKELELSQKPLNKYTKSELVLQLYKLMFNRSK